MRGATLNYVNRLMSHHALMVIEISELTLFNSTNYILIQSFFILNVCFKSYFSFRFMIISKFYKIVLKELSAVITVFFFTESSKSSNMEFSRKDIFFMVKDSLKNEYKFIIDVFTDAIFKKTEHVIQVGED